MKRGEVTMAILAYFSKEFDTVAYGTVLKKDAQGWFLQIVPQMGH